ncbi:MFS transporter [Enemella dayhoffiae]|uniref:MFS transporter n=1 Tax=Enemella dayhoffiae TaxID=2016507 RepID=UPI0011407D56|nr:MFS transporter [Enemella dayhoffiae]
MEFVRGLRRLWRHPLFRRLVAVRIATQASDGTLQIGMAAYVLFSPQQQPDAASIALVLAITLLPFSIIGPFVSLTLDRWNRRQVAVVTDVIRVGIALLLGVLVLNPELREHWTMWLFYAGVLVAMSLNRYLLAGLSAALQHTVDEDEYLIASSVMPTIGPAGVLVGAAVAFGIRFGTGAVLESYQADALVFTTAAAGFALTVVLALRIPRRALGPDLDSAEAQTTPTREVLQGLVHAVGHLRERRPAGIGLVTIGVQRVLYGMTQVATILLFRNWFHRVEEVDAAMADIGMWAGATGAGFIASAALVPPLARRVGVRRSIVVVLVAAGVLQVLPGSIFTLWTLVAAGFGLGICSQSLKICVDTLVQAHVDDDFKGRVFTLYDMIFNACFVLAACLTALLLPADGHTLIGFVALGVLLALTGVAFWLRTHKMGSPTFDRGTAFEEASSGASRAG